MPKLRESVEIKVFRHFFVECIFASMKYGMVNHYSFSGSGLAHFSSFLLRHALVSEKLHFFCDSERRHKKGNDGSDRA